MTWPELTDVLNKNLSDIHEEWTESAYRKKYSEWKAIYEEVFSKESVFDPSTEYLSQKRELEQAKIAFRDERRAWQKQNYDQARYANKLDLLESYIKDTSINPDIQVIDVQDSNQTLVICLSDWHIGAEFYSFKGCYNTEIAEERLSRLLSEVISIAKLHKASSCKICICGDLISGSIHKSIQVTNSENIIKQLVLAGKLVTKFISNLTPYFSDIYVCGVSGNHSRLAKKEDALKDERLDFIPLWYSQAALSHYPNITVNLEEIDSTVAVFEVESKIFVAVHGDYDGFTNEAVSKLVMWLGYKPDVVIYGHKHFPAMHEAAGITMIQTGSLCGSGDDFTQEKRLSGEASQTILVCDSSGIVCCYPIKLS